jgi:hypothetical protein
MGIPSNAELARAERIDPDSLLTEEDRMKPLNIRTSLPPFFGKRTSLVLKLTLSQPKHASLTPSAAAPAKTAAVASQNV